MGIDETWTDGKDGCMKRIEGISIKYTTIDLQITQCFCRDFISIMRDPLRCFISRLMMFPDGGMVRW